MLQIHSLGLKSRHFLYVDLTGVNLMCLGFFFLIVVID